MSKKTKKRNKQYRGADAAASQPVVHRYSAVQRGRVSEWWHEKRSAVRIISIVLGVVLLVVWLLAEAVRIIF